MINGKFEIKDKKLEEINESQAEQVTGGVTIDKLLPGVSDCEVSGIDLKQGGDKAEVLVVDAEKMKDKPTI